MLECGKIIERNRGALRQQRTEAIAEIPVASQRQRAVGQPMIGMVAIDNTGAASRAARELNRSFDTFRP